MHRNYRGNYILPIIWCEGFYKKHYSMAFFLMVLGLYSYHSTLCLMEYTVGISAFYHLATNGKYICNPESIEASHFIGRLHKAYFYQILLWFLLKIFEFYLTLFLIIKILCSLEFLVQDWCGVIWYKTPELSSGVIQIGQTVSMKSQEKFKANGAIRA